MNTRRRPAMRVSFLALGMSIAVALAAGDDQLQPKTGGTENDPLIQLEVRGLEEDNRVRALLACLNQFPWASRTAVLPRFPGVIANRFWHPKATAVVAVGERQWADVA